MAEVSKFKRKTNPKRLVQSMNSPGHAQGDMAPNPRNNCLGGREIIASFWKGLLLSKEVLYQDHAHYRVSDRSSVFITVPFFLCAFDLYSLPELN